MVFAALPLALFVFKSLKMFFLYRSRLGATRRQSLAAGLAGLALSHTIARAMVTGFVTRRIGFFRTPKKAQANAFVKALGDAREELLFATALVMAVGGILFARPDAGLLDTRVWMLMLAISGHTVRVRGGGVAGQRSAQAAGPTGRRHGSAQGDGGEEND